MADYKMSLCWLRRDLRLEDHVALEQASKKSDQVAVVFVFDKNILDKLKNKADRRVTFIFDSLMELKCKLEEKNSSLIILYGDPKIEIPDLAKKLRVQAVFTNSDYDPYAKRRDLSVSKALQTQGIEFLQFKDHVIFSGREVLKKDASPYRVFTPYKNAWLKKIKPQDIEKHNPDLERLVKKQKIKSYIKPLNLSDIWFSRGDLDLGAGEKAAQKALSSFSSSIHSYGRQRDFPADESGTSRLSVHLRFGTISIRECVRVCKNKKSDGSRVWLSELIWRDFYQMILDQFPYVEKKAFLQKYQNIKWPGKSAHFKAWCEGQTGYPIVDAAMRQLNQTGWMHNRLRMVAASFLVKDLLVDWRKGEKYFAEKLLDFDLAANNGGWQWCASTGCDAQPYFRIFNPESQSRKFDPEGEFIRKWIPELKHLDNKSIHCPPPNVYIPQIVDHSLQRVRAIDLYKI